MLNIPAIPGTCTAAAQHLEHGIPGRGAAGMLREDGPGPVSLLPRGILTPDPAPVPQEFSRCRARFGAVPGSVWAFIPPAEDVMSKGCTQTQQCMEWKSEITEFFPSSRQSTLESGPGMRGHRKSWRDGADLCVGR